MKKSFRVLTMALAAVMILSAAAVSVSASPFPVPGFTFLFGDETENRDFENLDGFYRNDPFIVEDKDVKVTKDNYLPIVKWGNRLYEFQGIGFNIFPDSAKISESLKTSVTIKGNQKDTYYEDLGDLNAVYGVHHHVVDPLDPYFFDNNLHWKYCTVCGGIVARYHRDVDDDGICDICAQPIFYRNVTVKQAEGGKVEVSKEKCMLTNRVAITVTPDEGYVLSDIRGINDNEMHSVRPCIVDRKGSRYHLIVDVWDVEIQPTFVKAN